MKVRPLPVCQSESRKTVFGVASSRIQANRIVDHLANAGFEPEDISVMFPDSNELGRGTQESPASAAVGNGTALQIGLAVGGAIGWLAGLDTFSAPGVGHFIAGGPLGLILGAAGGTSSASRGVQQALVGLGMRRHAANLYQDRLKEGQILICLQTDEWRQADAARKIFQAMGASNISISGSRASRLLKRAFSRVVKRSRNPSAS